MSIHRYLTRTDVKQLLTATDHTYLKRQLRERTVLSRMLNRPVNEDAMKGLAELLSQGCLPRRKPGSYIMKQFSRLSDGIRHPCIRRKMTTDECIRFGVNPAVLYRTGGYNEHIHDG